MGRSKLTDHDVAELAKREGVPLAQTTLATWRTRCPEVLPFIKIGGRVFYERSVVERFLHIEASPDRS